MKKILNFTKKIYVLIILSLLFSHIVPISEIKAEEDYDYYLDKYSSGSGFIFSDKDNNADDGKYGFMNIKGEVVVGLFCDYIGRFKDGLAMARIDGKYGYIDKDGWEVVPFKYSEIGDFHEGLAFACRNGKYGYVDKEGNEVIPFKFDGADDFENGYGGVRIDDKYGHVKKLGHVNKKGKVTYIKNLQKYEAWTPMSEGFLRVQNYFAEDSVTLYGCINKKGKEVIPVGYTAMSNFNEGLVAVREGNKWGYINKKGKVVVPFKYDDAYDFHEGLAEVYDGYGWGYINKKGKEVTPLKYYYAYDFHEGLALVSNGYTYGYINKKGKEVIPLKYYYADNFNEGLAVVDKGDKCGYINKKGKVVIPFKYSKAKGFNEGLAAVQKGDKWGYINKKGKVVIPFMYANADGFSGGLARAYIDGVGWATINKKGIALYSEPQKIDDKFVFINKEGKKIVLTDCLYIEPFSEGLAFAQNKNGKWGYIDENGNPVTEFEYDNWGGSEEDTQFHDGGVLVRKGDKYGAINKEGKVVIPIEYGYNGA